MTNAAQKSFSRWIKTKESRIIAVIDGFKQKGIIYEPHQRFSGVSKYPLKKMLRFALQGITSFSTKPLYAAIYFGLSASFLSILFYIGYLVFSFTYGHTVSGWASILSTIVFFGGLNLLVLGIMGIYLGKMFMQVKNRPTYIVRTTDLE